MPANITHNFGNIPHDKTPVWRYMDFAKFAHFLTTQSLYFSSVDNFGDSFEGYWPESMLERYPIPQGNFIGSEDERTVALFHELIDSQPKIRKETFISCWHSNEHESEAMWQLYGLENQSIAIKSSTKKLVYLLPEDAYIGLVKYIDYEKDWIPIGDPLFTFFRKRMSFEHEKELRVVIRSPKDKNNSGISIPVIVNEFIDEILIGPSAPKWYLPTISSLIQKLGFTISVNSSSLAYGPPSYML